MTLPGSNLHMTIAGLTKSTIEGPTFWNKTCGVINVMCCYLLFSCHLSLVI